MALFRTRTAVGAGVLATLILVLAFGNQAFTEWVINHANRQTVWGWFLHMLSWPAWAFGPADDSGAAARELLARDLRALLLLVFVALVLGVAAKSIGAGSAAFIVGWAALVFASALAAFATAFITADASLLGAFGAAAGGSAYGLFVGWIAGIAVAGSKTTAA